MKKLLLVAAIGVAGLTSAKDTKVVEKKAESLEKTIKIVNAFNLNASEKVFQLCGVNVTFYDADGNISGYDLITSDQNTLEQCQGWQSLVKHRLQKEGYRLTPQ